MLKLPADEKGDYLRATDLRDLAKRADALEDHGRRVADLRKAHRGKSAFIGRLDGMLKG